MLRSTELNTSGMTLITNFIAAYAPIIQSCILNSLYTVFFLMFLPLKFIRLGVNAEQTLKSRLISGPYRDDMKKYTQLRFTIHLKIVEHFSKSQMLTPSEQLALLFRL